MACELIADPDRVPGGRVATIGGWVVEHCVGPLGVGTMIVKPERHVVHLSDLDPSEVAELSPALTSVAERYRSRRQRQVSHRGRFTPASGLTPTVSLGISISLCNPSATR